MKILATFDESPFSEAIIPVLSQMAALPGAEIDMCSVAEVTAAFDQDAVAKRRQELESYLAGIAQRLPPGPAYRVSIELAMFPVDAATVLVERIQSETPDVIVMATHGRSGIARALLGSVAEQIVHAGVAPVLLVHPRRKK